MAWYGKYSRAPGVLGGFSIKRPDGTTMAYVAEDAQAEADAQAIVEALNRQLGVRQAPDLVQELTAWLDANTVRCGHGGVLCGICIEAAARDGFRYR
jgi:hypothetical protein